MKRFVRSLLLLGALLPGVLCVDAIAASAEGLLEKDFPRLSKRFKPPPADYVLLVDRSLSMQGRMWAAVSDVLSSFVSAVPDGDYLSVVLFGTRSGLATTPTAMSPSTRSAVGEAIEALRAKGPTDLKTDLGDGLDRTLAELNRPGGNSLKFVFLLTDFNHDPPKGNRYPSASGAAWDELVKRCRNEQVGKVLQVYALLLPLEANVGKDLEAVRRVFPALEEEWIRSPEALSAWFKRRSAEIARDKLRAMVRSELEKPMFESPALSWRNPMIATGMIEAMPLAGSGPTLAIEGTVRREGILEIAGISYSDVALSLEGAAGARVAPRASGRVAVTAGSRVTLADIARVEWPGTPLVQRTIPARLSGAVTLVQEVEPAEEVTRLNVPESSFRQRVELAGPAVLKHGSVSPVIVAVSAVALLIAVAAVLWYRRKEVLWGTLVVAGKGKDLRIPRGAGKTVVRIGNVNEKEGCRVDGVSWALSLRTFWPTTEGGGRPRGVYASMQIGSAQVRAGRDATPRSLGVEWVEVGHAATIVIDSTTRVVWTSHTTGAA